MGKRQGFSEYPMLEVERGIKTIDFRATEGRITLGQDFVSAEPV
jgi:hypothetical protein